ncbi:MAG: hypothetical protein ABJA32_10025 [Ginsengibacter sp.]|jgi:hypothetical protein
MNTIIVKPRNTDEYNEILTMLRKLKIKTEIYKSPTKTQVLKSIEDGARSAAAYLNGNASLQDAKSLLGEL